MHIYVCLFVYLFVGRQVGKIGSDTDEIVYG